MFLFNTIGGETEKAKISHLEERGDEELNYTVVSNHTMKLERIK